MGLWLLFGLVLCVGYFLGVCLAENTPRLVVKDE